MRIEGYDLSSKYDDATLVVVNICGFIDAAKQESLEAIGEALHDNGRLMVTGCLGANEEAIRAVHPAVECHWSAALRSRAERGARARTHAALA